MDYLFDTRKYHPDKIIMPHIKINSLRNKFDMLTNSVTEYINILKISKTKRNDRFSHFLVDKDSKLNLHKMFRRRPGRLIYVQVTCCVYGFISSKGLFKSSI